VCVTNFMDISYFIMPCMPTIIMALKLNEEFKVTFFMTNLLEDDMVVISELCLVST